MGVLSLIEYPRAIAKREKGIENVYDAGTREVSLLRRPRRLSPFPPRSG